MAELKTYNVTLNSTVFKQIRDTRINIGGTAYKPVELPPSFYFFVVIDRSSGQVVKEYTVNSVTPPATLPLELQDYNDSSYIWLFVSGNMGVTCFPSGKFYEFFREQLGAGEGFEVFQQVVQQGQNTGLDNFCYALAAIPGEPKKSIESYYAGSNSLHSASLIIQLEPKAAKGKKELLTPILRSSTKR
jgi:hypothetical protein